MQIWTIQKGFNAFECKFEPFEMDLKHSNANSNHSKGIWSIQKGFEPFKRVWSIRTQILTIWKGFEPF